MHHGPLRNLKTSVFIFLFTWCMWPPFVFYSYSTEWLNNRNTNCVVGDFYGSRDWKYGRLPMLSAIIAGESFHRNQVHILSVDDVTEQYLQKSYQEIS